MNLVHPAALDLAQSDTFTQAGWRSGGPLTSLIGCMDGLRTAGYPSDSRGRGPFAASEELGLRRRLSTEGRCRMALPAEGEALLVE